MRLKVKLGDYYWAPHDPHLSNAITSASFQSDGKTDVSGELLIISVKVGRIYGKASLLNFIGTLSGPGALFDPNEKISLRTSAVDTARKTNLSPIKLLKLVNVIREIPFSFVKNSLNRLPTA